LAEGGCPGTQGPAPVLINSDAGSYCIDSTEVTNAQYALFLASGYQLPAADAPIGCEVDGGSMNYTPNVWPVLGGSLLPVVQVNYCQAYAYCAWAGKRMCGEIGGGALLQSRVNSAADSQWYNACSATGTLAYPYGNTFSSATCGGMAAGSQISNVKTPAACTGGFPGLYNMSGNVWEWTDACSLGGSCYTMGGAFDGTTTDLECVSNRSWAKNGYAGNIGIRCCGDL
jgi:formylglycine-generating enzyme required for sulfatase activity